MSSSANARGPWNEGRGPWFEGESWEYIEDPIKQVLETQGQLRKSIQGTRWTKETVAKADKEQSQKRSQEVKSAVPKSGNQWSSYPQSELGSPKQVQPGQ
jgi:Mn-containing catalase